MTNRKIQYWVIPPESDAEFAASMEAVIETYEKPYDPGMPVLCMDEQPVQFVKETRTPIEPTLHHGKRVDYEYERAGTANLFMFTEPLSGWREVAVREQKTKIDWAIEMAHLLEGRYAGCQKVIVVCDNLNTHTQGAFYEAFAPGQSHLNPVADDPEQVILIQGCFEAFSLDADLAGSVLAKEVQGQPADAREVLGGVADAVA